MTHSIISQHIIGATSLSCCQVTSTFRPPKPVSSTLHGDTDHDGLKDSFFLDIYLVTRKL